MNEAFKTYHLPNIALDYFKNRLDQGVTLSKYLKQTIDLSLGHVITYLPEGVDEKSLLNFGSSILHPPISAEGLQKIDNTLTTKWLSKYLQSFLSQHTNSICILERPDDYPQQTSISYFPFQNILYNKEPYYILKPNDSIETIEQAIIFNTSHWPQGMGICTTIENLGSYITNNSINNENFFTSAISHVQKIYIQAYDHDGYLVWEKN